MHEQHHLHAQRPASAHGSASCLGVVAVSSWASCTDGPGQPGLAGSLSIIHKCNKKYAEGMLASDPSAVDRLLLGHKSGRGFL